MKGHLRVMDMLFHYLIVVMVHRCVHVKNLNCILYLQFVVFQLYLNNKFLWLYFYTKVVGLILSQGTEETTNECTTKWKNKTDVFLSLKSINNVFKVL